MPRGFLLTSSLLLNYRVKKCIYINIGGLPDRSETTVGKVAEFNMWDYAMNEQRLNSETCGEDGNIVSKDTLKKAGPAEWTVEDFSQC